MGSYPSPGNVARLSGSYMDETQTLADPTVATVMIKPPTSDAITVTPERDGTGRYHYDVLLDEPGTWAYRFIGAGAVIAQTEDMKIPVPAPSF